MTKNQKIIILGATGLVGKFLVTSLIKKGYEVVAVGRSKAKIKKVLTDKVQALSWDEFKKNGHIDPKGAVCVINLAGAGIADKRWTARRKKEILESRVEATEAAVSFCLSHNIALLNASAIGIYGSQTTIKNTLPKAFNEQSLIVKEHCQEFLSSVCWDWEQATNILKESDVRTVNLRIGVVLDKNGGALKKMALPFYLLAGGPIGSGDQPVSWISLEDICQAIMFIIEHSNIQGPINLVAPNCVTQKDLGNALGKALHRPSFMPTPGVMLKIILGELAQELLLKGQHVYPQKLLDEGFKFKHEKISDALADIYA